MKFLDQVKVYCKAGNGGPGSVAFRREKFVEYGGPWGGNGGRGGDVRIIAVDGLNTLIDYRYQQHFRAGTGNSGEGDHRTGADGADLVMKVPVGTEVLAEDRETVIADLTEVGQSFVLLKGGDGGFGNAHYKSSTNRSPRKSTPGWPGGEAWIWLRLKLIADAGLVGQPNAGKSTFLAACTAAKPKIADYPFTTLHPNLGVVGIDETEFVLADIPGLIEGAHLGVGIGDRFLGHIERCRVLLHLVDATNEDPVALWRAVRKELRAYGGGLARKPEITVLNKIDAVPPEELAAKRAALKRAARREVHMISAATNGGVREVLRLVRRAIGRANSVDAPADTPWSPLDANR